MNRKDFIQKYTAKHYLGDGVHIHFDGSNFVLETDTDNHYLGDGTYIHFDGSHFLLETERKNGIHIIGLEPAVFDELIRYTKEVYANSENLKD